MNKVELKGNVGLDPKPIITESGAKGIKFSMATTELVKVRDSEIKEEVTWHNIVAWESRIKHLDRIKKGAYIEVAGKIKYNRYKGNDGIERFFTEILAQHIILPEPQAAKIAGTANNESTILQEGKA